MRKVVTTDKKMTARGRAEALQRLMVGPVVRLGPQSSFGRPRGRVRRMVLICSQAADGPERNEMDGEFALNGKSPASPGCGDINA